MYCGDCTRSSVKYASDSLLDFQSGMKNMCYGFKTTFILFLFFLFHSHSDRWRCSRIEGRNFRFRTHSFRISKQTDRYSKLFRRSLAFVFRFRAHSVKHEETFSLKNLRRQPILDYSRVPSRSTEILVLTFGHNKVNELV